MINGQPILVKYMFWKVTIHLAILLHIQTGVGKKLKDRKYTGKLKKRIL